MNNFALAVQAKDSPETASMAIRNWRSAALGAVLALVVWLLGLSQAHADIIPPKNYAVTPSGLNVADGSLTYSVTDLAIGTLKLERYHRTGNSAAQPNDAPFGGNFSHNFDIYITAAPKYPATSPRYPIVHIGKKASGVYSHVPGSSSVYMFNLDAQRGYLSWNGSQYVYIDGSDGSGTVYTFSATIQAVGMIAAANSRKIERIDFPDGRRQTFSYNSSGNLKLVEDSGGYAMVFDYNSSNDITAACAFNRSQNYVSATSTCAGAAMKTTYGYVTGTFTVTDVMGQVTTYTMGGRGITCIKPPGFSTCTMSVSYVGNRVSSQVLQDGGSWGTGGMAPEVINNPENGYDGECANETALYDPSSLQTTQTFSKSSPCSIADGLGNTTLFRYEGGRLNNDSTSGIFNDGTFLMEATYPEGNKYLAEYLGPYRLISKETMVAKPGSGLANLVKAYGYGPCGSPGTYQNCGKPIWVRDPKLNQTDFTYASHGGLLSEMQPAPAAGQPRPLKLLTYVSKYAYIKNSGGSLVQSAYPTWLLSTETRCQTVAASSALTCDSSGPQVVTTYQYGPDSTANNLLVRGAAITSGSETRRSCYGYDPLGRRISETKPNANLSVCP